MTRKHPWFPFYAADWLGDERVTLLPLAAQGAYVRLLAHSWIEGSIPSSSDAIGVLLGDRRAGRKLWPLLAQFWDPKPQDPGRLVNGRLEAVRAEQNAYSAAQRERAKLGNASRWGREGDASAIASAIPNAIPSAIANGSQTRHELRGKNRKTASQNDRYSKSKSKSESEPNPKEACLLSGSGTEALTVPRAEQLDESQSQTQKASKLFPADVQNPEPEPEALGPLEAARRAAIDAVLKNLTHDPQKKPATPADIPRVYGEPG